MTFERLLLQLELIEIQYGKENQSYVLNIQKESNEKFPEMFFFIYLRAQSFKMNCP